LAALLNVIVLPTVSKASITLPAAIPVPLTGLPTTRFVKLLTFVITLLPTIVSAVNCVSLDVLTTNVSVRATKLPVPDVIVARAVPPRVLAMVIAPVPVLTVLT
jgi:hypothetical protein